MKVIKKTKERIISTVLIFVMALSCLVGITPMEVKAESEGQKIASLESITTVDTEGKKFTVALDRDKEYVYQVIESNGSGVGNLFNEIYEPIVADFTAKMESGVDVLAKEDFTADKIAEYLSSGEANNLQITRGMSNVIKNQSSISPTVSNGGLLVIAEVKEADRILYTDPNTNDTSWYYITLAAHMAFIPATLPEGDTIDVKLDINNLPDAGVNLIVYSGSPEGWDWENVGDVSLHDVPVTMPADGFARVFAYEEFTIAAGDATVSEIKGGDEGYYYEITNFTGDTTITINPAPVESVTIDTPKTTTLTNAGESVQLTAVINPANAYDKNVTWQSSNTAVATVDANGKVVAVGNGTAVITVTTNDGSKTASVTVTVDIPTDKPADKPTDKPADKPEKVTSKDVQKNSLKINEGLKVDQKGSTIKVSWGKVSNADGYKVYVQYCGKSFKKTPNAVVKGAKKTSVSIKKINGKKLALKKNYKIYVVAYKTVKGKDVTLGKSITAHIVGRKNTKYTNVKKINVKKSKYTLKVNKTATIKASTVLVNKNRIPLTDGHAKEFRYATSNKKVATVSSKGIIKAVGKGKCTIYIYARNGYCKKVSVTVK